MSLKGIVKLLASSVFGSSIPMRGVGEAAPDFTAIDHRGETVSLAALRGSYVVLWFFPKADTPG